MATPTVVHLRGNRAGQPAAAVGNAGVLYCVTDEGDIVERSNGTTWESYSPASVDEANVAITGGSITGITDLAIADGGTGQSTATAAFDALSPTTTAGDLIFHNGTDNVRLGIGTAGQVLRVNGGATAPEWVTGGSGVSGPVSSTDNAVAAWDGTGGSTLKNSALVVGASDATIGGNGIYRAGGTDIPVADGGTGVSTLTAYAPMFGGTSGTGAVQSGTTGTAGQVLTSNGAGALPTFQSGSPMHIVATQTVAGAAATSIDFTSGIDLDAHECYMIIGTLVNASGSDNNISLYSNNDTTLTNYRRHSVGNSSGTVFGGVSDAALLTFIKASDRLFFKAFMARPSGGGARAIAESAVMSASSTDGWFSSAVLYETASNVTRLTFTGNQASGLAIGSKITIWRFAST